MSKSRARAKPNQLQQLRRRQNIALMLCAVLVLVVVAADMYLLITTPAAIPAPRF